MNCDFLMKWNDILDEPPQPFSICWAYVNDSKRNKTCLCIWNNGFVDIYERKMVQDVKFWMNAEIICPQVPPKVKQEAIEQFDWLLPQLA